ncbi:MAG: hypothetical protein QN174_00930 [Armatimonadota bacterium]|nr:hypothetical protein [Armatimonadota bacterium]MDR7421054.1 hypothetical protein [Armatimonadota bacterium]MDR7455628.1 hypothetical protein [Armatimonadota bacterium]MDR7456845.1 hypothetical protein [Armatimonadota bacterium]MDR7495512.1 hypothetical protein [Armatimonadota bacterium]
MNGIACAHHADRLALGYCAGCGKPLCSTCLVRLSAGNYCEACARTPGHRPVERRAPPRSRLWVVVGAAAAAAAVILLAARLL